MYKCKTRNLTDADLSVLFCVKFQQSEDKIKFTNISQRLGLTLPAITHKVNDLKIDMLLKIVSSNDKRIINIELTPLANSLIDEIMSDYYRPLKTLTEFLGEEDTKELNRILEKANSFGKLNK